MVFGGVATLAGLTWSPTVRLSRDDVEVARPPDQLLREFRDRFSSSPTDTLCAEPDRLIRRFAGRAGAFSYRTVELVTYDDSGITFEHLAGPFSSCDERFDFSPCEVGTRITHTGTFRLRGGIWAAPLAFGPVKHAFEAHVREHLEALVLEHA